MRVLVLSDIHANLAALDVVDDAKAFEFEAGVLGRHGGLLELDQCIARMRLLKPRTVVGNHDWAVIGRMDTKEFNREASRAVLWTCWCRCPPRAPPGCALPNQPLVSGDFTLTHGSPRMYDLGSTSSIHRWRAPTSIISRRPSAWSVTRMCR